MHRRLAASDTETWSGYSPNGRATRLATEAGRLRARFRDQVRDSRRKARTSRSLSLDRTGFPAFSTQEGKTKRAANSPFLAEVILTSASMRNGDSRRLVQPQQLDNQPRRGRSFRPQRRCVRAQVTPCSAVRDHGVSAVAFNGLAGLLFALVPISYRIRLEGLSDVGCLGYTDVR